MPNDGEMYPHRSNPGRVPGRAAFLAAAAFGIVHAGFSVYWAVGGKWLLWSLGSSLLESFEGWEWLLFPIGIVKLVAAVTPFILAQQGWWRRRLSQSACWLGAAVLVVWGGLNTVVGNLVLAGVIQSGSGFDRLGMIGHAWLWDPLFLVWGVALCVALFASRRIPVQDPASGANLQHE